MMKRYVAVRALVLVAALLADGCGGGSGVSSGGVIPQKSTGAGASATFVVKVPAKASGSTKHPHYITANVASIDFTVTQTANPGVSYYVFYALNAHESYCSSSGSGLTCTLAVAAPPGNDTFVVNLYDVSNGTSYGWAYVIATGNVTATISAQQSNTISITTDGVPTYGLIGLANNFPLSGSAATIPVTVNITDADGDIIVGSYDQAVALSDSDTSGATALSKTTLNGSSDANGITLSYSGATLSNATITLTSTSPSLTLEGVPPTMGTATLVPGARGVNLSPSTLYFATATAAAQTLTASGANGGTAPFNVNAGACNGYATVTGSGPSFTVTPQNPTTSLSQGVPQVYSIGGSCSLNVNDSQGDTTTIGVIIGN